MDNRKIDVTSEGADALELAIRLAWPAAAGGKATHYKVMHLAEKVAYYGEPTRHHFVTSHEAIGGTPTFILLWSEEQGAAPLPFPLGLEEVIPFVAAWLTQANWGPEPGHDGCSKKGWRAFNNAAEHRYSIVAVQPAWAMYGK